MSSSDMFTLDVFASLEVDGSDFHEMLDGAGSGSFGSTRLRFLHFIACISFSQRTHQNELPSLPIGVAKRRMDITTLENRAFQHFDDLLRREELLWTDTEPLLLGGTPFDFEFRVAPAFKEKPILSPNAKGRSKDTDPFGDDDPAFEISHIADTHTLRLNKFCVVRPQFVLHTSQFERQSDHLSSTDILALWKTLCELGREKYACIYNCGAQAGSSIGHKHMQVFPKSSQTLFPDSLVPSSPDKLNTNEVLQHPQVAFEHAILPLAQDISGETLYSSYKTLCKHLQLVSDSPHNVFLTDAWIIVIPRTMAKVDIMSANAASMLGMVWVKNESELQAWKDHGPMNVLTEVGIPRKLP